MPQAVAGAIITKFAITSVVGVALVNIGVGVGFSILSNALQNSGNTNQSPGINTKTTTIGESTGQKFVLGRYATAGNEMCPKYSHRSSGDAGPGSIRTRVIDLGDVPMPGSRLDVVFVNGIRMQVALNNPHPDFGYTVVDDKFADKIWFKYYDGTQTAADPMMLDKYGDHAERPWTASHIGRETPIVYITQKYDEELFSGDSQFRFEIDGIHLYDISRDTTEGGSGTHRWNDRATWEPTTNPMVMCYNIARGISVKSGKVFGGRYTAEDLPPAIWIAAINACRVGRPVVNQPIRDARSAYQIALDNLVPAADVAAATAAIADPARRTPAEIFQQVINGEADPSVVTSYVSGQLNLAADTVENTERFQAGFEVNMAAVENGGTSPIEVMEELAKSCAAEFCDVGGVLYVQVGLPDLPDRFITDDDLMISDAASMTPIVGLDQTYNAVTASYPSADLGYETREAIEKRDLVAEAQHGRYRPASLNLRSVTSEAAAQDVMSVYLKDAQRVVQHTLPLPPEYHDITPLKAIDYTSAFNGYSGKDFQVTEISIDTRTLFSSIAVREIDPTDTAIALDEEVLNPKPSVVQLYFAPDTVPGWAAEGSVIVNNSGDPALPVGELSWATLEDDVSGINYEVRNVNTLDVVDQGTIPNTGQFYALTKVLASNTGYAARGIPVANRQTVWTDWAPFTTPSVDFDQAEFDARIRDAEDAVNSLVAESSVNARNLLRDVLNLADSQVGDYNARQVITASVETEIIERTTADSALASQITTVQAVASGAAAAVITEQTARADADSALASSVTALGASLADADAQIVSVLSAKVDANGAIAAVTNEISASYGSLSGLATDAAFARAGVNGIQTGFIWRARAGGASGEVELVAASNPISGSSSQFSIKADRFRFLGNHAAFFSDVAINGSLIVAGSLGSTQITNGAITTAKIAANAITADKITANAITADKINANAITTDKLTVGSITTDRINGNAVTNVQYSVTSTIVTTTTTTFSTFHSTLFDRDAGFQTIIDCYIEIKTITGGANDGEIRIKRNGTVLRTIVLDIIGDQPTTIKFFDANTSGGTTLYSFEFRSLDAGDNWQIGYTLVSVEQKKR